MKKVYQIFTKDLKEVCIPSTDYYGNRGEWDTTEIEIFRFIEEFQTEEEAITNLEEGFKLYPSDKNEYIILPVYKKI